MPDGSIKGVYITHDSYLDGVGHALLHCYNSRHLVDALMEVGEMSSIGDTPEQCKSYADRDGEERWWKEFPSKSEYEKAAISDCFIEYAYLWEGEKWFWFDLKNRRWIPLTEDLVSRSKTV